MLAYMRLSNAVKFASILASGLVLLGAQPVCAQPEAKSIDQDVRIDTALDAFRDPQLLHILTRRPRIPGGHVGIQPFDQDSPAAQADFRTTVTSRFRIRRPR